MVQTKIKDDWMETYTGRKLWIQNPDPRDIRITDISHALSQICRFNGHTNQFYSVAQHCVYVSELLERAGYDVKTQMWGLFHDAAEAYLGDIIKPLKPMLVEFDALEENFLDKIAEVFKLGPRKKLWKAVKWADIVMVNVEGHDLMRNHTWVEPEALEAYSKHYPEIGLHNFSAVSPREAVAKFSERYIDLSQFPEDHE